MVQVYIGDMPREKVLCALFNNARPADSAPKVDMTEEEAKNLLKEKNYIKYHNGRRLFLEFSNTGGGNDKFIDSREYDQEYYQGLMKKGASEVIIDLRFSMPRNR